MQHRRINVAERDTASRLHFISPECTELLSKTRDAPCETTDERHKLVQIRGANITNESASHDDTESEKVLEPLDASVALSAALEQAGLHDTDSGEQLQWDREEDCSTVEELDLKRE
jgi:hypothetical protein